MEGEECIPNRDRFLGPTLPEIGGQLAGNRRSRRRHMEKAGDGFDGDEGEGGRV